MPNGLLIAIAVACFACAYIDRRNVPRCAGLVTVGIMLAALALARTTG
jgi:hypothetical protein